jgi:hypothetical protein
MELKNKQGSHGVGGKWKQGVTWAYLRRSVSYQFQILYTVHKDGSCGAYWHHQLCCIPSPLATCTPAGPPSFQTQDQALSPVLPLLLSVLLSSSSSSFFFLAVLEFKFRVWGLLDRCCTTWATPPALFCFSYFSLIFAWGWPQTTIILPTSE